MAKAGSSLKPQVTMARRELDLALGKNAFSQAATDDLISALGWEILAVGLLMWLAGFPPPPAFRDSISPCDILGSEMPPLHVSICTILPGRGSARQTQRATDLSAAPIPVQQPS
jgi:hypothetical protein